jgi:DNA repair exonuclease SbcCD ATPase subunit
MKVAEPMVLARLQSQLLQPKSLTYITSALGKAVSAALNKRPDAHEAIHRQLEQERRKLQNLISAIEGGSDAPSALMKAVVEREAAIKRLEKELKRAEDKPTGQKLPDLHVWVEQQLQNLTEVLKTDAAKTKAEFRRLNLQLTFSPVEAKPRAHFLVTGQCDLSALAFFYLRSKSGALLDRTLEQSEQ